LFLQFFITCPDLVSRFDGLLVSSIEPVRNCIKTGYFAGRLLAGMAGISLRDLSKADEMARPDISPVPRSKGTD
jgi:hypothetical protein